MDYVADLHLHSKYSRAVSKDMVLPLMAQYAQEKGLDILSAADWTHPLWFKEIQAQLEEAGEGVYKLKSQNAKFKSTSQNSKVENEKETLFLLSVEISSIYTQNGKLRRIHNLVFAPDFEIAAKINKELIRRGCNLMSDGRPIIGLSSKNLLQLILEIDERCLLIPCHIWTPHFGIYGSASGFDSLEEAFEELADQIYGIETGLSSDPVMNWQVKELQNRSILSFSDAHSLPKMGREATVFELSELSYESIRQAIMRPMLRGTRRDKGATGDKGEKSTSGSSVSSVSFGSSRILYTIEFYPEEGKYHFSGHRNCNYSVDPGKVRDEGNICPVCKRRLTEGVLYRVEQLSDTGLLGREEEKLNSYGLKWHIDKNKKQPPYVKLVPLNEIIAEATSSTVFSQKVKAQFAALCLHFGSEIEVLLKTPLEEIEKAAGEKVAEGIGRVRSGSIVIDPGYDGEYGKVEIWPKNTVEEVEKVENVDQLSLV